jgi:hypothetical protein
MPLWLIPMLYLGSSVACGLLLPRIEKRPKNIIFWIWAASKNQAMLEYFEEAARRLAISLSCSRSSPRLRSVMSSATPGLGDIGMRSKPGRQACPQLAKAEMRASKRGSGFDQTESGVCIAAVEEDCLIRSRIPRKREGQR